MNRETTEVYLCLECGYDSQGIEATAGGSRMSEENAPDHGIEPRPRGSPLGWLARIALKELDATKKGHNFVLQCGDRRVAVDLLADRTAWKERIGIDDDTFGERWARREIIEGRWHVQTTAGLLLWDVSDTSETEPTRAVSKMERGADENTHESEVC